MNPQPLPTRLGWHRNSFTQNMFAILTSIALLLSLLKHTSLALAFPAQQHPIVPNQNNEPHTIFRDLRYHDLPAVTTIVVDAFLPSAMWAYLFYPDGPKPHRRDIWDCVYVQIEASWPYDHTKTQFKVIAVPNPDETGETKEGDRAVALAVWHIRSEEDDEDELQQSAHASLFSPASLPFHPTALLETCLIPQGINITRALDAAAQTTAIDRKYFGSTTYPQGQLYLNLLATHPSWDGHGFAAKHVRWGMELAKRELEVPVTLLATPAGWPVYDGLGFDGVANETVRRLDEGEELWFEVMKWEG